MPSLLCIHIYPSPYTLTRPTCTRECVGTHETSINIICTVYAAYLKGKQTSKLKIFDKNGGN